MKIDWSLDRTTIDGALLLMSGILVFNLIEGWFKYIAVVPVVMALQLFLPNLKK